MKKGLVDKADTQYNDLPKEADGQVLLEIIENAKGSPSYVYTSPTRFMELKSLPDVELNAVGVEVNIPDFKNRVKSLPDVVVVPKES